MIVYDISTATKAGAKRLHEMAKLCEAYGARVQKSVFEARLGEQQVERFIGDVMDTIVPSEDSVVIYRIAGDLAEARLVLGRPTGQRFGGAWVV